MQQKTPVHRSGDNAWQKSRGCIQLLRKSGGEMVLGHKRLTAAESTQEESTLKFKELCKHL